LVRKFETMMAGGSPQCLPGATEGGACPDKSRGKQRTYGGGGENMNDWVEPTIQVDLDKAEGKKPPTIRGTNFFTGKR